MIALSRVKVNKISWLSLVTNLRNHMSSEKVSMIGDNDPTFCHFELINWRTTRNDLIFMAIDCLIICILLDRWKYLFVIIR